MKLMFLNEPGSNQVANHAPVFPIHCPKSTKCPEISHKLQLSTACTRFCKSGGVNKYRTRFLCLGNVKQMYTLSLLNYTTCHLRFLVLDEPDVFITSLPDTSIDKRKEIVTN